MSSIWIRHFLIPCDPPPRLWNQKDCGVIRSESGGLWTVELVGWVPVRVQRLKSHGPMAWALESEGCCPRVGEDGCLGERAAGPFSAFVLCPGPQELRWCPLDWQGRSPFLSVLIQMLISHGNTFIDTSKSHASPAIWASFSPVKMIHRINPESSLCQMHYDLSETFILFVKHGVIFSSSFIWMNHTCPWSS